MPKSKQQKAQEKAEREARQNALIENIAEKIQAGLDLDQIADAFRPKILNRAMSHFAQHDYTLIEKLLGRAPTAHRVLLDECMDINLIPAVHQNLGIVSVSADVFGKGIKDRELFAKARDDGFSAILTADHVSSGQKDLRGIASSSYESGGGGPHIFLLPQTYNAASAAIKQSAPSMRRAMDADASIYDFQ